MIFFGQELVFDGLQLVDEGHVLCSVVIEGQITVLKYMFSVQEVYLLRIWNFGFRICARLSAILPAVFIVFSVCSEI